VELLFKIFIVPGALWIAYLIGLFAAIKMGGRDDIAGTYYAVITIPVALIAAGTLAFWHIGLLAGRSACVRRRYNPDRCRSPWFEAPVLAQTQRKTPPTRRSAIGEDGDHASCLDNCRVGCRTRVIRRTDYNRNSVHRARRERWVPRRLEGFGCLKQAFAAKRRRPHSDLFQFANQRVTGPALLGCLSGAGRI
jgi:hypothetical protein